MCTGVWRTQLVPARARPRRRVRSVGPRGAEREKPAREARFEKPLYGRTCLRWLRSLSAAPVPCQRHFRAAVARTGTARTAGPARTRGRRRARAAPAKPCCTCTGVWRARRASVGRSRAAGTSSGEKTLRHSSSRARERSHRTAPCQRRRGASSGSVEEHEQRSAGPLRICTGPWRARRGRLAARAPGRDSAFGAYVARRGHRAGEMAWHS